MVLQVNSYTEEEEEIHYFVLCGKYKLNVYFLCDALSEYV